MHAILCLAHELWPLPVRACHESLSWLHLASEKHSPPALAHARCLVRCYGSRCEDRVCRASGTITLVQYAAYFGASLCLARDTREFAGVSFDSDYSGEGDASFLLFFEVCWYFLACLRASQMEFEDTANGLLSFACAMQNTGADTSLREPFECQPMYSASQLPNLYCALACYPLFERLRSLISRQRGKESHTSLSRYVDTVHERS